MVHIQWIDVLIIHITSSDPRWCWRKKEKIANRNDWTHTHTWHNSFTIHLNRWLSWARIEYMLPLQNQRRRRWNNNNIHTTFKRSGTQKIMQIKRESIYIRLHTHLRYSFSFPLHRRTRIHIYYRRHVACVFIFYYILFQFHENAVAKHSPLRYNNIHTRYANIVPWCFDCVISMSSFCSSVYWTIV